MLFIGTQFSNLYTAVDTPARGRVVTVYVHPEGEHILNELNHFCLPRALLGIEEQGGCWRSILQSP